MEFIKVTAQQEPRIALIELNRPKQLNAINPRLMEEMRDALLQLDQDPSVHVIVITGNEKAFAAGADIKQMMDKSAVDMLLLDQFKTWDQMKQIKKPIIGAVSGFALGGGCELAMACDIVVASETAQFGQPEIKIGTIPGAGGTQRLTHAVGKSKAMELILTGAFLPAKEAHFYGLVSHIFPVETYLKETFQLAHKIAQMSPLAVQLAKEAVNRAFEAPLEEGIAFERKNFYMTFGSEDQKEGMQAFIEKRKASFKGQ